MLHPVTKSPDMDDPILLALTRIADALETIAGKNTQHVDFNYECLVWDGASRSMHGCRLPNTPSLACLIGIDQQKQILFENTRRFMLELPANHALLWGAPGMGKSALIKAIHRQLLVEKPGGLILVEIMRDDLPTLPHLIDILRKAPVPTILFCDDLSFSPEETSYKSLKSMLEGGLMAAPDILFYATSNRRHLMPRQMIDNEQATAINPGEANQENVSLSDRFGLWLGFYPCDEEDYQRMVSAYATMLAIPVDAAILRARAFEWALTRGGRSGRVAWQFIRDLAAQHNIRID